MDIAALNLLKHAAIVANVGWSEDAQNRLLFRFKLSTKYIFSRSMAFSLCHFSHYGTGLAGEERRKLTILNFDHFRLAMLE